MRSPSTQAGPSASATEENSEQNNQLDPRFDVADKPSRFFNFGRVFKTLWVEPAGKLPQDGHPAYNTVGYGQFSYAKMRHFVVIRKRLHSCLCLAIHTYGGQGAAKTNIRSQDHAVVYSSLDTEPQPLPDENITIGGFAIVLEEPGETIAPMSRIDFGKVYTIEHNLKILRVGRILPNHLPNLEQAFVGSLLGPALARQAPDPMPQPPQKHNSPSLIYWSDKNVEGYHTLPAEQHHVQDHQFYQLGKVFLVMMHLIDQRDPGRFIFIVLEKGSKSCKCVAIQKNFDPSFAKFSPVVFDGWLGTANNLNQTIHIRVKDSTFLESAADSCVNDETVWTVDYNVLSRDIGYVDLWSLSPLIEKFKHVHQDRLQMRRQSISTALSADTMDSWSDLGGRENARPSRVPSVLPLEHAKRDRGSPLTSYPQILPPQNTFVARNCHASIDNMQPQISHTYQIQQPGFKYEALDGSPGIAPSLPLPERSSNRQVATYSSRPPPQPEAGVINTSPFTLQITSNTCSDNEPLTTWTELPPALAIVTPQYPLNDSSVNSYGTSNIFRRTTIAKNHMKDHDERDPGADEMTDRFRRLRS